MANGFKIDREHLKPLPVGNSGWAEFSQTNYTVDKTLLIKDLIDDDTGEALEALLRDGRALVPPEEGEEPPEGQAWVRIPNREFETVFPGVIVEIDNGKENR